MSSPSSEQYKSQYILSCSPLYLWPWRPPWSPPQQAHGQAPMGTVQHIKVAKSYIRNSKKKVALYLWNGWSFLCKVNVSVADAAVFHLQKEGGPKKLHLVSCPTSNWTSSSPGTFRWIWNFEKFASLESFPQASVLYMVILSTSSNTMTSAISSGVKMPEHSGIFLVWWNPHPYPGCQVLKAQCTQSTPWSSPYQTAWSLHHFSNQMYYKNMSETDVAILWMDGWITGWGEV